MKTTLQQETVTPPSAAPYEPPRRRRAGWLRSEGVLMMLVVAAGFAFIGAWALRVTDWGVMPDEILYTKLSLGFGLPSIRDHSYGHYTPLYPLLTSPAFHLFDMPTGFRVAHGINALMMASAAIPAYLLGRTLRLPPLAAAGAAALTVVTPWVVFANFLMTESLAYPAFVWAVWGTIRAAETASPRRDLVAVALVAVATLTRTQFIALGAILPATVFLHELLYPTVSPGSAKRGRPSLAAMGLIVKRHWVLAISVVIGALALVGFALTGGVGQVLGAYTGTLEGTLFPHGTAQNVRGHMALLGLGVGFLPLILGIAFGIAAVLRPWSRAEHAFAILLGIVTPVLVLEAASVNMRTIGLVQERYIMFLAPLLFVAAMAYMLKPRLLIAALTGGVTATVWFGVKLDYALDNSFSLAWPFQRWLEARVDDIGDLVGRSSVTPGDLLPFFLVLATLAVYLALRRLPPRRVTLAFAAIVLAFCAGQTAYNFSKVTIMTDPEKRLGRNVDLPADWVDQALPAGAKAGAIPGLIANYSRTRLSWWDVEFWNKSVDAFYEYTAAWLDTPFRNDKMGLEWESGALTTGRHFEYAIVPIGDRRFRPAGRTLAKTEWLELIELTQPPSAAWALRGTDSDGWSGPRTPAFVHLFSPGAGGRTGITAVVQLTSSPTSRSRQRYRIEGGSRTVRGEIAPERVIEVAVPACLRPERGTVLSLHVPDPVTLASGKRAGLAITGVRMRPAPRCAPA